MVQENYMEFNRSIIEGVEIKQCRKSPLAYKSHVHKELSLGFILKGSTKLSMNERAIQYKAGDGVIIPPLMTHRCAPNDSNHWSYIMLFVDTKYYQGAAGFHQAGKLIGKQALKLKEFIEQLLLEKNKDTLENILIELLLEFGEKDITEEAEHTDITIHTIHDYILKHVNDEVTLDTLQQISGLNKFSIIRNFKKLYVTTPAAYHLQCRVAEAKRLLRKGVDVFDICEELRFYDQAHLIHEYKKMYGITPGVYLEQIKG